MRRAFGHNDQVERAATRTRLVDEMVAIGVGDLRAGNQAGRRALQSPVQQVEQHAAADSEAVRRRMKVGVGKVEHAAAAMGLGFQPDDPGALCQRRLLEAKRPQHGEPGGLQQKPRS